MGRIRVRDTDALGFLIDWLDSVLPEGIAVGDSRRGDALPAVTVRLDGGFEDRMWTGSAQVGINVWAETEFEAQDLALDVRSWIEFATEAPECVDASCSLPAEVTDSSRDPRRYMTARLTLVQSAA